MTTGTGSWQKALWPGVDIWLNEDTPGYTPEWSQVFKTRTSNRAFEQAVDMSMFGTVPVKDQGTPIEYDDSQQTYINTFTSEVRALGTKITLEAYRYNQYNLDALSERPKALKQSFEITKELVHADVFDNGFSSSYTMGASSDSVALFSASHPVGPYGADQSNLVTAADLSETTLEDACIQIAGMKDPRGLQRKITPFCLVIPRQLAFIAGRITDSDLQNDTAHNAKNILKSGNYLPGGTKINHYLDDSDAWFVLTSINEAGQGLIHYKVWDLEFGMDNDSETFDMKVKGFEAYSKGWGNFRLGVGSQGA